MIAIPKYSSGDIVNVMNEDELIMVTILETSVIVETQDVYYKVSVHNAKDASEFVVSEDQIVRGYDKAPIPAFSVGDVVVFHVATKDDDLDTRVGVVEEVYIKWDSSGYVIYYQTDETPEGIYTYEEDIICKEVEEELSHVV